jgi:hypothetical protein
MKNGSKPADGGFLILTKEEADELLEKESIAGKYLRKYIGSSELINNSFRYCLWLNDVSPNELRSMTLVLKRVELVREFRTKSVDKNTQKWAKYPSLFQTNRQPQTDYLVIPRVSSENRKYIPIAFFKPDVVISDAVSYIPNATPYLFGILTSEMHMTWVKYVCGRLKSDYRYSKDIVYNNFPFPENITDKQKQKVENCAQKVLDTRAKYPDSSLADLYDPLTMPPDLTKAHQNLDKAVDLCYRPQPFVSELNRIEYLFNLYENLTAPLLKTEKKKRTKKTQNLTTNQESDITD